MGDEGIVKYCDKGDTEEDLEFGVTATAGVVESVDLTAIVWSEFVVPTTTGVVESVDLTASVWSEFVLGDLEFVVPVESVDLMACVGSFEKPYPFLLSYLFL